MQYTALVKSLCRCNAVERIFVFSLLFYPFAMLFVYMTISGFFCLMLLDETCAQVHSLIRIDNLWLVEYSTYNLNYSEHKAFLVCRLGI